MANSWQNDWRWETLKLQSRILTTSPGTFAGMVSSVALLALLSSPDALARRYTTQYAVAMDPGAQTMTNKDRLGIANLMIDSRDTFANNGPIVIYAYTDEAQAGGVALTRRRVASAIEYLRTLGVSEDRINVEYDVWTKASDVPSSSRYRLLLELLPGKDFHD